MVTVHLADRTVLAISGPDTHSFLQGLITNDIERLTPSTPLYAAILTPQGKILFDFLLFESDGVVLVDCWAPARDALLKRLAMYRLRAKVEISPREDLAVFAAWGGTSEVPNLWSLDPRLAALGGRAVISKDKIGFPVSASSYLDHRLDLGVPEGPDFGQDKMFALDAGLDELHGVAFEKGCYVGQELTARMKHRGTARKRLLPITAIDGTRLAAIDASVTANGLEIGTLMSTYGARGFALIRLDRLEEAAGAIIESGGVRASVTKPACLFA